MVSSSDFLLIYKSRIFNYIKYLLSNLYYMGAGEFITPGHSDQNLVLTNQ